MTKPIATVSPTATTTTAVRDSQKSFAITRITRDVDQTVQHDGQHSLENRREGKQERFRQNFQRVDVISSNVIS